MADLITAEVSIYVRITDGPALIAAARAWAINSGCAGDDESAAEMIADDDYGHALRCLLDPDQSPPGVEILDTTSEVQGE